MESLRQFDNRVLILCRKFVMIFCPVRVKVKEKIRVMFEKPEREHLV